MGELVACSRGLHNAATWSDGSEPLAALRQISAIAAVFSLMSVKPRRIALARCKKRATDGTRPSSSRLMCVPSGAAEVDEPETPALSANLAARGW
jgi:hypothetical protein